MSILFFIWAGTESAKYTIEGWEAWYYETIVGTSVPAESGKSPILLKTKLVQSRMYILTGVRVPANGLRNIFPPEWRTT